MRKSIPLVIAAIFVMLAMSQAWGSAASATAAAPNCGAPIAKSTGGHWVCTFDDEFSGTKLDTSKWQVVTTADSGYRSGQTCMVNTPQNVSVSNGYLNLTNLELPKAVRCKAPVGGIYTRYTGASVTTAGLFSQTYGRFEVRAKFPASVVAGLQTSLWLTPANASPYRWPRSGEIDIAEYYSVDQNLAVPYIHYVPKGRDANVTATKCAVINPNVMHTYALVWTSTSLTISYDGTACLVDTFHAAAPLTGSAPFNVPFAVNLTQALGVGKNGFRPSRTPLPATSQIDYVRVWK